MEIHSCPHIEIRLAGEGWCLNCVLALKKQLRDADRYVVLIKAQADQSTKHQMGMIYDNSMLFNKYHELLEAYDKLLLSIERMDPDDSKKEREKDGDLPESQSG